MTRRLLAGLLIAALAAPVAAQPAPGPSPVELKVDEATEYFRVGNFEAALAAFREAYALEPRPDFLYAMATIEEQRGGCAAAIELYQQFLDTDPPPPPDDVTAVTAAIEACKGKLGIEDKAKQPPEEPIEEEPPPPRSTTPRPWYSDTLGLVLTGTGVLALGTGGVVYGLARGDLSDAEEPGIAADEYTRRWDAAKSKQTIAFVSAGLGGALVLAGVLHLVLADHGSTSSESPRLSITPGAGDLGLGLVGHF